MTRFRGTASSIHARPSLLAAGFRRDEIDGILGSEGPCDCYHTAYVSF
jgi:hypothetical protein